MLYIYQNKILVNAAGLIGDATCCCGACCYDDPATGKKCEIKTQGECAELQGAFYPGQQCDEIECSSSSSSSSSDSSSSSSDSSSSESSDSSSSSTCTEGEECAPPEKGPCLPAASGGCEQYVTRYYCNAGQCLPVPGTESCECSSSSSESSDSSDSSDSSSSSSSSLTTGWACILGWICDDCKQCFCYRNLDNCAGSPPGTRKFQATITVPNRFSLPVKVVATGGVDDAFMLDGDGTVFGQPPDQPAHGFTYEWIQENRTFTIEALDTRGACMAIEYTVCIMPVDSDPAVECGPVEELGGSLPCALNLMMPPTIESQWPTGPGTFLVKLLKRFAPEADASNCERRLKKMNEMGPNWCEKSSARILTWIQVEAEKRGYTFNENAARLILKRAIKLSRAAATNK